MILNKQINSNITYQEVNKDLKLMKEYINKQQNLTFKDLSDYELFIYSIIDTCNYGRKFKDSVENALSHLSTLENKEEYLKLLTTIDKEELF